MSSDIMSFTEQITMTEEQCKGCSS